MDKYYLKLSIYIPIIGLIVSELLMLYGKLYYGLELYVINLLIIIIIEIFSTINIEYKNILQSLSLLIILRLINFSMPYYFPNIYQYVLIYGIMFIPISLTIKNQHISNKELGMNLNKKLVYYIPISIIIGTIMAVAEFKILRPIFWIKPNLSSIIPLILVMFLFVGTVEELLFRSILQTRFENIFGLNYGLIFNSIIFGIYHASYGSVSEILFVTTFGFIIGYIFQKTRNLPFIISIHGTANSMLFGILPMILRN